MIRTSAAFFAFGIAAYAFEHTFILSEDVDPAGISTYEIVRASVFCPFFSLIHIYAPVSWYLDPPFLILWASVGSNVLFFGAIGILYALTESWPLSLRVLTSVSAWCLGVWLLWAIAWRL